MLIVVSQPAIVYNEGNIINALFNEGLKLLHIKKQGATESELRNLLRQIKPSFYPQIALHQHHQLREDFGIRRLHFPEGVRKCVNPELWAQWKEKGAVLSTSIHSTEDYATLPPEITYAFFGPVFNSISKHSYQSTLPEGFVWPYSGGNIKVAAIGGISENNAPEAFKMGFDGVAASGAIWQSDNPIIKFKKIQKVCSGLRL